MTNTNNIDKSNLRQVIIESPSYFEKGLDLSRKATLPEDFKRVCISGMGGSSLPVDALNDILLHYGTKKDIEVIINRSYSLPQKAKKDCLNVFASYSGGTEETISSLEEAIRLKLPSLGIAHEGKAVDLCKKNQIDCVILPEVIQPRYALNYFIAIFISLMARAGIIENIAEDIKKALKKTSEKMGSLEEDGKKIAEKVFQKTPVIHTSHKYESLARIWKIKINENTKTPAFYNVYPELNHNEMVGYTLPQSQFHIITLVDRNDNPRIIKRMEITSKLLKEKGIEVSLVDINGNDFIEKLSSGLLLGDWVSYYLALSYGQDPTPVDMVEDLKKLLA